MEQVIKFLRDEEGVTAVEYTLIAAITCLIIIIAFWAAREQLSAIFAAIVSALTQGATG